MSVAATCPSAAELRATFDAVVPLTIGLEEEVLLLDHDTLDLAARAADVLERFDGDPRVKAELPAAQIELVTRPAATVGEAIGQLAVARCDLARDAAGIGLPAAVGVHPFAAPLGALSTDDRYAHTRARFGVVARLQLVSALQVHVAVGGAHRTLAVHNALRSFLPDIAALAANAPFYAGRDSGLASVRPVVARTLPRQGVPPAIDSWDAFTADLQWGAASETMPAAGQWWWELRPHPEHGTLEVRVPDAQATVADAGGVAAFVHALVAWLADRVDEGEELPVAPAWRIEENRWSAARDGIHGTMVDLVTGERELTRDRLARLLGELAPVAARLGCTRELAAAHELAAVNGAARQRAAARQADTQAVARHLVDVFVPDMTGGVAGV
jgi:carboxylate-amine ligase